MLQMSTLFSLLFHNFQAFQMAMSVVYFSTVLSCYLSILYFLISMNEITNTLFECFFISHADKDNVRNEEMIPFRGVLILHQKLLKAMELYSDIVSTLIFIAFALGVLFLAVSFFEIIMVRLFKWTTSKVFIEPRAFPYH